MISNTKLEITNERVSLQITRLSYLDNVRHLIYYTRSQQEIKSVPCNEFVCVRACVRA